jgi:hypothetical protein
MVVGATGKKSASYSARSTTLWNAMHLRREEGRGRQRETEREKRSRSHPEIARRGESSGRGTTFHFAGAWQCGARELANRMKRSHGRRARAYALRARARVCVCVP